MERRFFHNREILANILVYHRPNQDSSCACGWAKLGFSWPAHVVDVYELALELEGM